MHPIHTFTVCSAVTAKAIGGLGFVIDLETRGFVLVEWTV